MIGKSTNRPASTPCMANDNAAVHGFRLLKVPLDSTRLSSNIPALLVFTTDTGNSKLAPAIVHDCAAVDSERTDGLVVRWRFLASYPLAVVWGSSRLSTWVQQQFTEKRLRLVILIYKFCVFPTTAFENHFPAAFHEYFGGGFLIEEFHSYWIAPRVTRRGGWACAAPRSGYARLFGSGLFGFGLFGSGLFGSGLFGSGLFGFGLSSMLIMMRYLVALDKATPNLEGARCPGLFKSEQGHQMNTIPLTSRKLFCLALTFRKSVGCTVWYAGCPIQAGFVWMGILIS